MTWYVVTQFVIRRYEEGVQIQILIPPLPRPWVNHSVCNQGMRKGCKSRY
jgi:hypothetical protein